MLMKLFNWVFKKRAEHTIAAEGIQINVFGVVNYKTPERAFG